MTSVISSAICIAGLCSPVLADVLIVDVGGTQGFLQVYEAVNAAQDGDTILVREGTYAAFQVDARSLSIVADVNATVKIYGGITIYNTSPSDCVLLSGLESQGEHARGGPTTPGGPALLISNNAGFVRVQACVLTGGQGANGSFIAGPGGPACSATGSPHVALHACKLFGGFGGGNPFSTSLGGIGGHGLKSSSSSIGLYDCFVVGGMGGVADWNPGQTGGKGGIGAEFLDWGVFASSTLFAGGDGGHARNGGDGGDGLVLQAAAQAKLWGVSLVGGNPGLGNGGPNGQHGAPSSGPGNFSFVSGIPRTFQAQALAEDSNRVTLTVGGVQGDQVWLLAASQPAHTPVSGLIGLWLVARPKLLTKTPQAVLVNSGTAQFQLPIQDLTAGNENRLMYLQLLVKDANGAAYLSNPAHLTTLNCSDIVPDCNGNGAFDTCDILSGVAVDCNLNSIPDSCESDCNMNGIMDDCDIASGTSQDQNNNNIPDECEAFGVTWYVDASAPAGGNGSMGSPFQAIGQGIAPALSGDTILVADGTYVGTANRNLSLGGRDLIVRSLGGPALCIIDCQDLGTGFLIQNGESAASRIEGFTIKNGSTFSLGGGIRLIDSNTRIENCHFVDCTAGGGGGIQLTSCNTVISNCRFKGNAAVDGGGIAVNNSTVRVVGCTFEANVADNSFFGEGGGLYVSSFQSPSDSVVVSRCSFLGNTSYMSGGAVAFAGPTAALLEHCVLVGNQAVNGSAIQALGTNLTLRQVTLTANTASQSGSIWLKGVGTPVWQFQAANCLLWDDPLANTASIEALVGKYSLSIERCDLRGGQNSIALGTGATLNWGPGNIDQNPLFADPDGPDNDPTTLLDNDYRLGFLSPCIDAGDNGLVPPDLFDLDGDGNTGEPTPFDLDGNPRFVDDASVPDTGAGTPPIVDLGPFERP